MYIPVYLLMKASVAETFWTSFVQLLHYPARMSVQLLTYQHIAMSLYDIILTISHPYLASVAT